MCSNGKFHLDKFYFDRYKCFSFGKKKSEKGKSYAKMLLSYDFKSYIAAIIDESDILKNTLYKDYTLDRSEIILIVSRLFYTHLKFSERLLRDLDDERICREYTDALEKNFVRAVKEKEKHTGLQFFETEIDTVKYTTQVKKRLERYWKYIHNFDDDEKNNYCNIVYYGSPIRLFLTDRIAFSAEYAGIVIFLSKAYKRINSKKISGVKSDSNAIDALTKLITVPDHDIAEEEWSEETYDALKQMYEFLFNKDNDRYILINDEDRFLEKQMLDVFFGCELMGFVLKEIDPKIPGDSQEEIIHKLRVAFDVLEKAGCLGIIGLTSCTQRIIQERIERSEKSIKLEQKGVQNQDGYYDNKESAESIFTCDILELLYSAVMYYIECIKCLSTHENRIDYIAKVKESELYTEFSEYATLDNNWQVFFECNNKKAELLDAFKVIAEEEICKSEKQEEIKLDDYLIELYSSYYDSFASVPFENKFLFKDDSYLNEFFS